MAQTTTLNFFSNLFANKNYKMLSYQETLIAPWNTCPFPTDNLVVISNIKALYMFIIYINMFFCNILKWFVEHEPFERKISNVVVNILELLFETPDF